MLVAATHLGQVSKFQWSVPGAVAPAMSCLGPGRPAGSVCASRPATHHAQGKKLIDHHKSSHVIDREPSAVSLRDSLRKDQKK